MLNFVICDDNLAILDKLSKMLESIFITSNYDARVSFTCSDADSLMEHIHHNQVDVLFLDIKLQSNISGLKLAEEIRKTNKKMYIIFTTGHLEYALLAYQVKTFDYIPKPITTERLESTISRLFDDLKTSISKFIKVANTQIMIKEEDIRYIKKDGMKIIYHTATRNYEAYTSFTKITPFLPKYFVRCHKSYIVNINKINNIEPNKNIIIFDNDDVCSIGPKFKNYFMEVFNNYGNFANNMECVINAK